jgi:hypothetical protein
MGPEITLRYETQGLPINRLQRALIDFAVVNDRQSLIEA